jgi:cytochrome c biogenesis protein
VNTDSSATELDPEGVPVELPVAGGPFTNLYGFMWRFFNSLRLTVLVIFLLAAGCVVGMFFDQTLTLEAHKAQWAEAAWKLWLFQRLEFHDVFHSWWFGLLIIFLALNLIACSIERLPKIWIDIHSPHREINDAQLHGIRHVWKKDLPAKDRARAVEVVDAILATKGRHKHKNTQRVADGVVEYAFNERHRYARTGVYIVHIALLIIMSGSIATTYTGIDGMMMIVEDSESRFVRVKGPGGLTYNHDIGFQVRCTDFRLKTFIDGAPMEFESDLEVWDLRSPINPVTKKTIQVNHPLEYEGYTFYQASYNPIPGDQLVQLDICKRPTTPAEIPAFDACKSDARNIHDVAIGDKIQMPDGTSFVPVEIIREYGGLGASVRVQQFYPDGRMTSFIVFRNYPKFDETVRRGDYIVGFRGFDQQYATGIQVGKTPFINVVFMGFIMMFVGMYMAFFMSQRRYWARVRDKGDGTFELLFAGAARRHHYAFDEEFTKMKATLTEVFGAEVSVADRARALRAERERQRAERKNSESGEEPTS